MDTRLTREDCEVSIFLPDLEDEPPSGGGRWAPPAPEPPCVIAVMARDFEVSERALRFYEDKGLLRPRREGRTRLYGARERRDLAMILKGKSLGFTLTEIADMLSAPSGAGGSQAELALPAERIIDQIGFLERRRHDLDAAIIALRQAHRSLVEAASRAAVA